MAIKIKKSHRGLLHKALGVNQNKKIPASKLAKARHSKSAVMRKRAVFAANAKKWNHGKGDRSSNHSGMSKGWNKKFSKVLG